MKLGREWGVGQEVLLLPHTYLLISKETDEVALEVPVCPHWYIVISKWQQWVWLYPYIPCSTRMSPENTHKLVKF